MTDYFVVVADASRARFFTLQQADDPEYESGPNLIEGDVLVNPENEMDEGEVFAETKSGRNRSSVGGMAHGYDDHRAEHLGEFERRFAQRVAQESVQRAKRLGARSLIVASNGRMLGHLRRELQDLPLKGVTLSEYAKDVTKLAPQEVQKHLASRDLVPERKPPDTLW
ncbi:MAG: host attachment protein [Candidatus Pacebacteria bacterium]|nr:host attachment protein [Candidatus Paceibacterota bacterium]